MANVDKNEEPSMEDILASIRKIISDDEDEGRNADESEGRQSREEENASPEDIDAMFSDAAADMHSGEQHDDDARQQSDSDEEPDAENVLELTSDMAVDQEDDEPDVVFADPDEVQAGSFARAQSEEGRDANNTVSDFDDLADSMSDDVTAALAGRGSDSLLSPRAQQSVSAAFNNLAGTILSKDARTLEDLVKEMLRPMLKEWLDDNLPQMVERMVREEIERVSRGR